MAISIQVPGEVFQGWILEAEAEAEAFKERDNAVLPSCLSLSDDEPGGIMK